MELPGVVANHEPEEAEEFCAIVAGGEGDVGGDATRPDMEEAVRKR
jgi:hypothetical protein